MRIERERLEQNNERLRRDLQLAQSADLAYAQVRHSYCDHINAYVIKDEPDLQGRRYIMFSVWSSDKPELASQSEV